MLELWSPDDAPARIEAFLRDAGFFGGGATGVVADLYLGYGLSRTLRRAGPPDPPEPCALPLAAVRIRPSDEPAPTVDPASMRIGAWTRTWDDAGYGAAIEAARASIAAGDVYQVNLVQHLSAPFTGDPAALATALAPLGPRHPRPLIGDGWAIVSASPELFLAREGDRLWTMPIKGTRPAGWSGDALRESPKDAAEHVMIVDLERNDLGRVCEPGSVRWPELMTARPMAGVVHLVSVVEGTARPGLGFAELIAALFPGGSVTGAPKIAAIDRIAALEPVGRGASMGALGTVHPDGDLDLALTIRTFAVADGRIHLWVGGGIVWDSDPAAEIEESWVKARPLLDAIGAPFGAVPGMSDILAVAVLGRGLVDPEAPMFAVDDVGMTRGQAAFETIRVYAGRPFALAEHLDRLIAGAARLQLPPVSRADLEATAAEALAAAAAPDCALRYYWTGGREGHGRSVVLATVSPIPAGFDEQRLVGIRVASMSLGVDSTPRDQLPWLLSGVKSTSYAVNMAARAESIRRGAEDALFLTADGLVLEGPTSNIWWRSGRTLSTPATGLGVLAGVTRTQIRALGIAAGYTVEEGRYPVADVLAADEAWMSSSVRELMPIIELDGAAIGAGRPGPATLELQAALRRLAHEV